MNRERKSKKNLQQTKKIRWQGRFKQKIKQKKISGIIQIDQKNRGNDAENRLKLIRKR